MFLYFLYELYGSLASPRMKPFKPHYRKNYAISNRNLLLVGILAFSLTLGASVTSTYAWFALSQAGKVSFMDFAIKESHSLEIGLKDRDGEIHYYDTLNDAILEEYFPAYKAGTPLSDLSSMYQDLWLNDNTNYETDFPILRQAYMKGGDYHASYPAQQGFYQFEFYFKGDTDMYLFLDRDETYTKALHEKNQEYADAYNEKADDSKKIDAKDLDNVVNATRVSFFSKDGFSIYEPNALSSSHTTFGGILDATTKDGYYDYDENNREIVYGEYDANTTLVYDSPVEEDSSLKGKATCFNAIHKAGIERFNLEKSKENGLSFKQEKTYTLEQLSISKEDGQFDKESMRPIALLKREEPTRVVVTIYLEGWDYDVTEAIGNGSFTLGLSFRGLAAPIENNN